MDLSKIELYLTNIIDKSNEFKIIKLRDLIIKIQEYRKREDTIESASSVLSLINSYSIQHMKLLDDYNSIEAENTFENTFKRVYKAQEILCLSSSLEAYIMSIDSRKQLKDTLYKYAPQFKEKKDYYKSEKFSWGAILKTLNSELNILQKQKEED